MLSLFPLGCSVPRTAGATWRAPTSLQETRFEFTRPKLGTQWRLTFYASNPALAERVASAAFARIDELDLIFSDYKPESELSQLSQRSLASAPTSPIPVSTELFEVLAYAKQLAQETGGAFDPTLGPLVRLWRRSVRKGRLPLQAVLDDTLMRVGHAKLILDPQERNASLTSKAMRIDLGGIAKGYILDQVMVLLKREGVRRALLDAGGDLLASEAPPGAPHWRVQVTPFKPGSTQALNKSPSGTHGMAGLVNAALATSGDAYQFIEISGVRYSHIINPRTGLGLTSGVAATVLAKNAMRADAMASALCVLGATAGIELIESQSEVEACVYTKNRSYPSSSFPVR